MKRIRREPADTQGRMRLQKFLSDAGIASRRHAEQMILDGRVLINNAIIQTLPAFVDPQRDRVVVDGNTVRIQPHEYWILHKPKNVVCTTRDPSGRRRAVDFMPPNAPRMFVVGRLDAESTGLVLLTNDGELAQRVTHPRFGVAKVYRVEVHGEVPDDLPATLKRGVYLAEGRASASEVEVLFRSRDLSAMEITLHDARNRQVRRMLARVGHKVKSLRRIRIGPLELRDLPLGGARQLSDREVGLLRRATSEARSIAPGAPLSNRSARRSSDERREAPKARHGRERAQRADREMPRPGNRPRSSGRRDSGPSKGRRIGY